MVVQCSLYDCSVWLTLETRGKLCSDRVETGFDETECVFCFGVCVFVCVCMLTSFSYHKGPVCRIYRDLFVEYGRNRI